MLKPKKVCLRCNDILEISKQLEACEGITCDVCGHQCSPVIVDSPFPADIKKIALSITNDLYPSRFGKPCTKCGVVINSDNAVRNNTSICCKNRMREKRSSPEFKAKKKKAMQAHYDRNKDIYKTKAKRWAIENGERRKDICKSFRWRIRIEMIEAYGGCCECCGETRPEFLSIDHRNNDGYKRRADGEPVGGNLYSKLKKMGWPKDDFGLLCMNCNFAKGHFGACPHTMEDKE